jgi:hypothetical protein
MLWWVAVSLVSCKIFNGLRQLRREWRGLKAFNAVPRPQRRIVFYSEGAGYWTYFQPVFDALQEVLHQPVLYVTSAENDPVLLNPPEGLTPFYVGKGVLRTLFFATLDVDVLVMTMPDLHTLHIKRSQHHVHYSYLHHSMVSTHMVYRPGAFDHFDSILCVGPHQVEEIRRRETLMLLPAKSLFEHGYGRLDAIIAKSHRGPLPARSDTPGQVLVAPSWGVNSLLELHGAAAIEPLLTAGLRVVLRPHPQTRRLNPAVLDGITARYANNSLFRLDEDADAHQSLSEADLMVSDWSGAALEFALGLERPVLFVDVPRKVLDPDYLQLGIEPLEAFLRDQVGRVVDSEHLNTLGSQALAMIADSQQWQAAAKRARERWVYNVGSSGIAGANILSNLLNNVPTACED